MTRLPFAAGLSAIRLARHEVETLVGAAGAAPDVSGLDEPRGAFVTLRRGEELRGCIGIPEPREPLRVVVADAARSAAKDPRFEPVRLREVAELLVEVSVLTPAQDLKVARPSLLPDAIRVGEHGLVVSGPRGRGLLLPQVATEWGFTADQFLAACCQKAGLPAGAWLDERLRLKWSTFGAQVFAETAPRGEIVERA